MKAEMSEEGEITVTAETKEEAGTLIEWLKKNEVLAGEHHLYDSHNLTFDARWPVEEGCECHTTAGGLIVRLWSIGQ